MNIANKITITRILMIPIYMVMMYLNVKWAMPCAGIVFIVAALTDMLDGYLARKYNLVTDLGKFMDPLADKLLVMAAVIILTSVGRIPSWTVILIIVRELTITTFRCTAAIKGRVLAADFFGKIKTIVQLIALSVMHFEALFEPFGIRNGVVITSDILFYLSLALTVYSGINYVVKNKDILMDVKV